LKLLQDIGSGFLNRTLKTQEVITRTEKWHCIKLKSFCTTKGAITTAKRKPIEWEKIFTSYSSDRELITRIFKNSKIIHPKQQTILPINGQMNWTDTFQMKKCKHAINTWKHAQHLYSSGKCKSKLPWESFLLQSESGKSLWLAGMKP
jgi:hypothetical protein